MGFTKRRILLTGGAGFIGARLLRDLLASGEDVSLLLRPQSNLWRIEDLLQDVRVLWADLRDSETVGRVVLAARPDVVFHLATHGVYPSQQDATVIQKTNQQGTKNLVNALRDVDYQALVYTGTAAEYAAQDSPIREDKAVAPTTEYGIAKAAGSALVAAEAERGRPASIVRIFSAYGPDEEPSRLSPYVMRCCRQGVSAQLTAGAQRRDFVHVDDVVSLLRTAAKGKTATILHAATGDSHSVREMVETIVEVTKTNIPLEFGALPTRECEPKQWTASIARTSQLTSWRPRFNMRSGILDTWQWYLKQGFRHAA